MKKISLLILGSVLIMGCEDRARSTRHINEFTVIEVDSGEYLKSSDIGGYPFFAHKGNCKYCAERRKQELKEK